MPPPMPTSKRAVTTLVTSGSTAAHSVSLVNPRRSRTPSTMSCCIAAGSKFPPPGPPPLRLRPFWPPLLPPLLLFCAKRLDVLKASVAATAHTVNMRLSFIEFFLLCLLVCFVSLQTTHACHLPNATRTYANNVPTQKRVFANES